MLKRHFMTGLTILLPIVVTFWLVLFIINFFTKPFRGIAEHILQRMSLADTGFFFLSGDQLVVILGKIFTILAFILLTLLLGVIIRWFAIHTLIHRAEVVFDYIPFVNKIYRAAREVVHTLIGEKKESFAQVVLVPFPHSETLSIGLLTRDAEVEDPVSQGTLISVFIPAAPNQTMGFMILFPKEQVLYSPMKVEEALRVVISCGAMIGRRDEQKHLD